MKKYNEDPQSIKDVLGEFVSKNKLQKGIDVIDVEQAWADVMGPAISKYTNRLYLDGTRLIVQLNSSVLRSELGYGRDKILKNLNEELGREVIGELILR